MAGRSRKSPYRVVVVDEKQRVKGVLTGRRVLEILIGRRGTSLMESRGVKGMLRENVSLFIDEPRPVFTEHMPSLAVFQYMVENRIGFAIIVDDNWVLQGLVDDASILNGLKGEDFGLPVKEIMTSPVHSISPDSTLMEAANLMADLRVRRLPVVQRGELKGLITITDLLNHLLVGERHVELLLYDVKIEDIFKETVDRVMSREVLSVAPEDDVGKAIEIMTSRDVSGLPVVSKDGRLVGLVSRIDVLVGLSKVKGVSAVFDLMVSQLVS